MDLITPNYTEMYINAQTMIISVQMIDTIFI